MVVRFQSFLDELLVFALVTGRIIRFLVQLSFEPPARCFFGALRPFQLRLVCSVAVFLEPGRLQGPVLAGRLASTTVVAAFEAATSEAHRCPF